MGIALSIRPIRSEDGNAWLTLRMALRPELPYTHAEEIRAFLEGRTNEPQAVILALDAESCVGLMELSTRSDIRSYTGQKGGYVEGLYVLPEYRRSNLVRRLLALACT